MSTLSRLPCAAGGICVNSMDGPALLFCEWHPCAANPKTPIRMGAHASSFGATLATDPSLPRRGWFLASMPDPRILSRAIKVCCESKLKSRLLGHSTRRWQRKYSRERAPDQLRISIRFLPNSRAFIDLASGPSITGLGPTTLGKEVLVRKPYRVCSL